MQELGLGGLSLGSRAPQGGLFGAGCEGAIAKAEEVSLLTLVPGDSPAVSPFSDPGALSESEDSDPPCSNPKGTGFLYGFAATSLGKDFPQTPTPALRLSSILALSFENIFQGSEGHLQVGGGDAAVSWSGDPNRLIRLPVREDCSGPAGKLCFSRKVMNFS